jgi:hypothetical protein
MLPWVSNDIKLYPNRQSQVVGTNASPRLVYGHGQAVCEGGSKLYKCLVWKGGKLGTVYPHARQQWFFSNCRLPDHNPVFSPRYGYSGKEGSPIELLELLNASSQ